MSNAPSLLRAAAVVRDRRDVFDSGHFDAGIHEAADRGLAARAWPLHEDLDLPDPMLHGAAVAYALVRADLHLALDVLGNIAPQVTFDFQVGVDPVAQADDLFVGEVTDTGVLVDPGRPADLLRRGAADPVDVGERDLQPL